MITNLPDFSILQLESLDAKRSLCIAREGASWRFMRYNWLESHHEGPCFMWDEDYHVYSSFENGMADHRAWLEGSPGAEVEVPEEYEKIFLKNLPDILA